MKNFVQEGKNLNFTAGATYSSGDPVVLGAIMGIVEGDVASGDVGVALVQGVVSVTKVSAEAWTYGDRIYWDASASKFTNVLDTDVTFAGIAVEAAANPTDSGKVLLNVGAGRAATVAALAQDISATYVEAEVQAISTKVDAILTALKNADLMA